MIELFAAFALGAVLSGTAFFMADRSAKAERKQLLDRVMARDYTEYRAHERAPEPTRQPTRAEREALEDAERLAEAAHGLV